MSHALSLREAARRLKVHHVTLKRWILLGEGPRAFIKPGRRAVIRIMSADLDRFIAEHTKGNR